MREALAHKKHMQGMLKAFKSWAARSLFNCQRKNTHYGCNAGSFSSQGFVCLRSALEGFTGRVLKLLQL